MMFVSTWTTSQTTLNYLNISEWLCQQYQHCVNVVSTLCQMLSGVVLKLMLGCGVVYALELCIYSFSFVPFVAFVASSSNFIPQSQMLRRPGNEAPQFSLTNFSIMST